MNRTYMFPRGSTLAAILASSLFAMTCVSSFAQVSDEPAAPPEGSMLSDAVPVQDDKIDKFADAYVVIKEIETEAVTQLQTADSAASAYAIKAKAEGQIVEAVERTGLKFEEFNQIAELATVDESLRTKIADRVEKRRRI